MISSNDGALRLKQARGWFVAGDSFRRAVGLLSDGAFKLFALLSLEADRHSGRMEVTQKRLAELLSRSRRAVGTYVAELEAKGVCRVEAGKNQYAATRFEMSDDYWPYHRSTGDNAGAATSAGSWGVRSGLSTAPPVRSAPIESLGESSARIPPVNGRATNNGGKSEADISVGRGSADCEDYVGTVRKWFESLGCGKGSFSAGDERFAAELERRGVGLRTVERALLLGGARKYESWLSGGDRSPIGSLRYFDGVIVEIEGLPPVGEDYWRYVGGKVTQYAAQWRALAELPVRNLGPG